MVLTKTKDKIYPFLKKINNKAIKTKKLLSAFTISSVIKLNLFHKNIDVNNDHFNCKTLSTANLDITNIRHNYGEMT